MYFLCKDKLQLYFSGAIHCDLEHCTYKCHQKDSSAVATATNEQKAY